MYDFRQIHHPIILTHTVLIGLTPLMPIPILDDVVKSALQRRLVRQIAAAHGQNPSPAEVDALLEEGFGSCASGCAYSLFVYPIKEIASKLFIFLEWRRALNLVSHTYYFFFLLDAALMDGYALAGPPEQPTGQAQRLRRAIETARRGANTELITGIFRRSLRPGALISGAWGLARSAVGQIPVLFAALAAAPRKAAQGVKQTPGRLGGFFRRARSGIYDTVQARVGGARQPGLGAAERIAARMQEAIQKLPPDHFDLLHARLRAALEEEKARREQAIQAQAQGENHEGH